MVTPVTPAQRFTRYHPCPICERYDAARRGRGERCAGYLSADGEVAFCTREELAGALQPLEHTSPPSWAHRLRGVCGCGVSHGPASASNGARQSNHHADDAREEREPDVTYPYRNADGTLRYEVVRYEPKGFSQRRPDGHGGWIKNLKGVERVPYRLPELLAADPNATVYLVEGEKDAERLASLGLVGTTTVQGAKSWHLTATAMAKTLRGRPVAIVGDADDDGDFYIKAALETLKPAAKWVRIVKLPSLVHQHNHGEDVSDWLDRHGGTVEKLVELASGDDDENTPNTYADWPDPIGVAAYTGPIGDFVRKLAPQTEAAPEGLLVQALVAAGNAMGRHGHCAVEADQHHTNLFAVMVGGTGTRKGVSWGHVRRLLQRADEPWEQQHIVGGLSTGEGLISHVQDDEPAIPDKVALAFEPEFASVFKMKGREGNTLSPVLRQAWDGDTLRTMTKNTPLRAAGSHISIIGHITPDELRRVMSETDAGNGFANRILWVCVRRARYLPDGGEDVNLNAEVQALHRAIVAAKTAGRLKRTADATQLWHQRYRDLSSGRPGLLGAVTNRAEAQVMRLSLIYALLDESQAIEKCHLEAALAVWDYCLASARFIFGAALGDALAEKIDAELARHGDEGMSRTELYNFLGNHHSAKDITAALGTLASQGRAEQRAVKGDAGRTTKRLYSLAYSVFSVNSGTSSSAQPPPNAAPNTLNTLYADTIEADGAAIADAPPQRPAPPPRDCYVCNARCWQWDESAQAWVCGHLGDANRNGHAVGTASPDATTAAIERLDRLHMPPQN